MNSINDILRYLDEVIDKLHSGSTPLGEVEGWIYVVDESIDTLSNTALPNKDKYLNSLHASKKRLHRLKALLERMEQSQGSRKHQGNDKSDDDDNANNTDTNIESTSPMDVCIDMVDKESHSLDGFKEMVEDLTVTVATISEQDSNFIQQWVEILNDEIHYLEKLMPKLTRTDKKKCETYIIKLISFKHKFTDALKVGGNLGLSKEKIQYDDFDSAFQRRIQAGNLFYLFIVFHIQTNLFFFNGFFRRHYESWS